MPPKKRPRREDERKDEDSETPPKPKRPLTAYNIFSQLERNYILQSDKDDPPVLPKSVDEDTSSRPEKYRDVIMPKNWFKVGKIKPKRRERENHGKISFIELTKEIAKRWNEADFEVKQYCRDVAGKELERYKKAKADFEEKYGNDTATNVKKEIETGQRKKHKSRQANKKVKDEVSEETNDEEAEEERKSSDDDRKLPASKNDCKYTSTANNKATASATAAELNEENSYSNVLGNVDCSLDAAGYRGIPQLPPIYHSTNEFVNHPPRAEISASSFAHSQSSANNANRERQGVEAEGEPLPFEPLSMNSNYAPNNSSSSTNNWNSNYPVDPEFGADFSEFLSRVLNNDEDDNGSPFSSSHSTSTPENEDENESMHLAYDYFSSARSQSRNSDSSDEAVDV